VSKAKGHNSILFLTTLGVFVGLVVILTARVTAGQPGRFQELEVNKRPLRDLAVSIKDIIRSKRLDLTAPFNVEIKFVLREDGTIDPSSTQFGRFEGPESSIAIVKDAIYAFSETGYFKYLRELSSREVVVGLKQDDKEFVASISCALENESRAKSLTSWFNILLSTAIAQKTPGVDQHELRYLKSLKATTAAKTVNISMSFPKDLFWNMIRYEIDSVNVNENSAQ